MVVALGKFLPTAGIGGMKLASATLPATGAFMMWGQSAGPTARQDGVCSLHPWIGLLFACLYLQRALAAYGRIVQQHPLVNHALPL